MDLIIDQVTEIIQVATEKHILPSFKHLAKQDIHTKSGATDFVTSADIAAEAYIASALKKVLPGALIIGEESAYKNPKIFDKVMDGSSAGAETFWLIDPIDGTKNFVEGKDIFGTMIALVKGGTVIAGWIYVPLQNILLTVNSTFPKPPKAKGLSDLDGATFSLKNPNLNKRITNRTWWGCAAYSYAMLLMGKVDFALFKKPTVQPWDHAAGTFFYETIGGIVKFADDRKYTPVPQSGTLILAPTKAAWQELADIINAPA